MTRLTWVALVATFSCAAAAHAGTLQGVVVVPEHMRTVKHANPYPGRAGSQPAPATPTGQAADAVVYLDHVAPAADSAMATHKSKPKLSQLGQAFAPRVVAVAVGTTVDFPNMDPIYHNVFSLSPPKRFDLGKYPRGHSRTVKFDKPGLINVFCDIHSDMAGYILVLPHHGFTRPASDGAFSITGVPAGHYIAKAWHPDFGTLERPVDVPTSGPANLEFRFESSVPARAAGE